MSGDKPFLVVATRKWRLVNQEHKGSCVVTFNDAPNHPHTFDTASEGLRFAREFARS